MDDLKLYGKNMGQLDSLVQTVTIFSDEIGMEVIIEKCAIDSDEQGEMVFSEGIELPSGEKIKSLEEDEEYKYLGILERGVQ